MSLFYISFAGTEGFRGAVIVAAETLKGAVESAWRLKINPGGEAAGLCVDVSLEKLVPSEYKNRLLSKTDLDTLDKHMLSLSGEFVEIPITRERVCEEHNAPSSATLAKDWN